MKIDRRTHFEDLPNELLIEIFHRIDGRNLYLAFYNLNERFNVLLQSLTKLSLKLSSSNISNSFDQFFIDRVETLIVDGDVKFSLLSYRNVRRIVLIRSTNDQIGQTLNNGENFERISLIWPRCFFSTLNFHEKIFSNGFPNLTSCFLTNVYSPSIEIRRLTWTKTSSMRSAKISSNDATIHVAVLTSVPNLFHLELSMKQLDRTPIEIDPHFALKRLKISIQQWPTDRTIFESLFRFLPFLRRLIVERHANLPESLDELLQFDWFASILPKHLEKFLFFLHLHSTTNLFHSFNEKFHSNFNSFHYLMKKTSSLFEDLPNEILLDVFKNLDARDLFRAFSQLNSRFNCLIRSFGYLKLTCRLTTTTTVKTNEEYFPFYVHTLIVDPWTNFPLHRFVNVRRLFLTGPLPHILVQFKSDSMPFIEHLSVNYSYTMYEIVHLHDKIFSNTFLHLSSIELIENERLTTLQTCRICPTIERLKFALIDAKIFTSILVHCPNLFEFQFTLSPMHIPFDQLIQHDKLKRLIIELHDNDWSYDDHLLDRYFYAVPQLEHLKIHRRSYSKSIEIYLDQYDWLSTLVQRYLTNLRSFHFIVTRKKDDSLFDVTQQKRFQEYFRRFHRENSRTRLIFLDTN